MANLDTMRRAFALEEEAPAEGGLEPRTTEERLAQYAAMDAAEETNAGLAGMPVDELRYARRGDARVAEKIGGDMTAETVRASGLRNVGGVGVPSSMTAPPNRGFFNPTGAVGLERTGLRLNEPADMPESVPSLSMPSGVPAKTTDFASLQKLLSPGTLTAPEAQPIPVANALSTSDAAAPVASAIPATGPQTPTGKPESMGTPGLPAPSSEGTGGDALGRLSLGQALTRALEGSGSVIAGRDLRSGAADTLGERMKQIEALRAKREERATEQAKSRAEAAAASKVTGEMLQSLGITPPPSLAELPSAEAVLKAGEFPAKVAGIQALTSQRAAGAKVAEARLPLLGGQVALTDARTQNLLNKDARDERAMQLREEAQDSMNELRKAQAESARAAALKAKNDPKASEAVVNSVKKTVEASRKLVTPTANNFLAIERVAPGMSRGESPPWLTREAMAGTQVSKELAPKVADLNAAVEALVMDIRHGTFGASLTGTEKASFEQLITNSIKDGPEALARALNQLRQRAAQIAQDHFSFDMDFHPQETSRALRASDIWKQALAEGGIYSDVWQMPETAGAVGGMTRMTGPDGQKYDVPSDKVEAAKAKGWKE